ncbi:isoleucine--tRNA ligase domain protein [Necator americanus]|uniref:isoleucine--tRNA ligase n=1 Tax=Necator americanus TaxID=51031 RepID=W2TML9_NECAM|nr:isoleucine--tRNA ligase domain protein [Necator americanus]ETN82904.1 isoleucine--tRNA ligase domain protein [Necator americanus]
MLFWEWRRIIRQFVRNSAPRTTLTYQQWTKRRLIISFAVFFIGWKTFGVLLNDMLFWTVDEETGEGHMLTPAEGRLRSLSQIFSSLGRIGQVIEVIFPEEIVTETLSTQQRVEYDTKLLLGSDEANSDLFIRRLVLLLASLGRRRRLIVSIGFDGLSVEDIATAMQQLQKHLQVHFYMYFSFFVTIVSCSSEPASRPSPSTTVTSPKKKTIFLPRTSFVNHVKSSERASLDQHLAISGGLTTLYEWQREQHDRKHVFELLDGPPYANGVAHTGHAINKILKDFIVKSRIALGYRVRFRPGWDCHGLPIELKISKSVQEKSPLEIRALARQVANEAIGKQMNSFRRWGVSADWWKPYLTMDSIYVSEQLRLFAKMIEKGVIFRAFKPVYWSPSSRTALAESELEYNEKHVSTSVFFRFRMIDLSPEAIGQIVSSRSKPLIIYSLVWTSTPWTLPLNNAICVSSQSTYVAISFNDTLKAPVSEVYLVAEPLLPSVTETIGRPATVVGKIKGEALLGRHYKCCWHPELALPVLEGEHVTMSMGTGLVHTSFAHGFTDYEIARARNCKVESFVDEDGRYTRHMGLNLEGKDVLGEGQREAIRLLRKDVIHEGKYKHSYPYDWRTKKPVIIRSSAQWFMDVSTVGKRAAELLEGIKIGTDDSDLSGTLYRMVSGRPTWCISRQRVWGTPIPALVDENGEAYISKELVEHVADLVARKGADVWWTCSVDDLATDEVLKSLSLKSLDGLSKGTDIMDVWMDSGVAWHCARKMYEDADATRPTDGVLEGVDQFRGWFQSLLLTSVATQDAIPYKRIHVHGFCVDDNNKKMSKSLGNVVDPETITDGSLRQKALGADGLRLWVALSAGETVGESKIGEKVLADLELKSFVRDRLYCSKVGSNDHVSAQFTLHRVGTVMAKCMAPLLPHLSAEFFQHQPACSEKLVTSDLFFNAALDVLSFTEENDLNLHPQLDLTMEKVVQLRSELTAAAGPSCDLFKEGAFLEISPATRALLAPWQEDAVSYDSQLCEVFGVSMIRIEDAPEDRITPIKSEGSFCERCRKMNKIGASRYCNRCSIALGNM